MNRAKAVLVTLAIGSALLAVSGCRAERPASAGEAKLSLQSVADKEATLKKSTQQPSFAQLVDTYGELGLVDAHNHDASGSQYLNMGDAWTKYQVHNTILFGNVSEPSAITTDEFSWSAYQSRPDFFIPYFSGFDLHDPKSLEDVKANLEKGYFGLGEIAAASTYSPVVSKVAWKANDPMDGYLPQIYDLIADYKAPILVHIDPPSGEPVAKLEQALKEHPNTIFIFGHMNAYNSPEEIDRLLSAYPNLYADFFAGFSVYNPEGGLHPELFVPVIKKHPDRFMLSTDSGYGLDGGEEKAIEAMYRMLYLLDDPKTARMIARDNLMNLIQAEPATATQLKAIGELEKSAGKSYGKKLSKLEAGKILAEADKG